jgi:hypothetical protein
MKAGMGHAVSSSSLLSCCGILESLDDSNCFQAYEKLVSETVTMALYATQRRQAIKKDDINKKSALPDIPAQSRRRPGADMHDLLHPKQTKVLSKKTAIWPAVLADAQLRLREVFGMELVELRSAGQGDPALRVRPFARE